jgi:ankyrin repeat protein
MNYNCPSTKITFFLVLGILSNANLIGMKFFYQCFGIKNTSEQNQSLEKKKKIMLELINELDSIKKEERTTKEEERTTFLKAVNSCFDGLNPKEKCQVISVTNDKKETLLYRASQKNDLDLVTLLLSGLDKDQKCQLIKIDWLGWTALHGAVFKRNPKLMKLLLKDIGKQQQYELFKINDGGHTVLFQATIYGELNMVKILLDGLPAKQKYELLKITVAIPKPGLVGSFEATPLFHAARRENQALVKLLLENLTANQISEILALDEGLFADLKYI